MADTFKACSINGCNGSAARKHGGRSGLCCAHARRRQRYGTPLAYQQRQPEICVVGNCRSKSYVKGLCVLHYQRWRRHGFPKPLEIDKTMKLIDWHYERQSDKKCLVDGCQNFRLARGFCRSHYEKNRTYGDPLGGRPKIPKTIQWLYDNAHYAGDDCLTWPFCKNQYGYAIVGRNRRPRIASRFMCEIVNGPAPSKKYQAAHLCGNGHRACCNPRHLKWATPKENISHKSLHNLVNGSQTWTRKLNKSEAASVIALLERCL